MKKVFALVSALALLSVLMVTPTAFAQYSDVPVLIETEDGEFILVEEEEQEVAEEVVETSLLELDAQLDSDIYGWDGELDLEFTLFNPQSYDVALDFPTSCLFQVEVGKVPAVDETFAPLISECIEFVDIPVEILRNRTMNFWFAADLSPFLTHGEGAYQVVISSDVTSNQADTFDHLFMQDPLLFNYVGVPVEENPISTRVTIDKSKYDWNDIMTATVTLTNESDVAQTLQFSSSCYFDASIVFGDQSIDNFSDRMCTQAIEEVEIGIEEPTLEYEIFLNLASMAVQPQGQYTVNVDVNGVVGGQWIVAPEIQNDDKKFTFSGNVELEVEVDHERYLKTKAVIGTWSLKNNGSETFVAQIDGCDPALRLFDAASGKVAHELDWNCDETPYIIQALPDSKYTEKISLFTSLLKTLEAGSYFIEFMLFEGISPIVMNTPNFELYYSAFSDTQFHWARDYITELQELDAVSGFEMGNFHPNQSVTRAEFLKMSLKGLGFEVPPAHEIQGSRFDDSNPWEWHYPYVETAYRLNVVKGYGDLFYPEQRITRAEALTILMRMSGLDKGEYTVRRTPFSDLGFNDWFAHNVLVAYELDIVSGYNDGKFGPHRNVTRGETAKMISEVRALMMLDVEEEEVIEEEVVEVAVVDCGSYEFSEEGLENETGLSCFIEAAKTCSPAKLKTESTTDFFGLNIFTIAYREIMGLEDERCTLFQRTDDQQISVTEENRQLALENGSTEEEIDQQLLDSNQFSQDTLIGKDTTCHYPTEELVDILEREKQGSVSGSTSDYETYQCTGSLLEQ
jgi:hypothetical protein